MSRINISRIKKKVARANKLLKKLREMDPKLVAKALEQAQKKLESEHAKLDLPVISLDEAEEQLKKLGINRE